MDHSTGHGGPGDRSGLSLLAQGLHETGALFENFLTEIHVTRQSTNMTVMTLPFTDDIAVEDIPALGLRDVYDIHFDYVWRVVKRLGARPADQEDLVHDVFVTFIRTLDRYDSRRPIRPWLCGIAFRLVSTQRKRASYQREIPVAEHTEASATPDPSQTLESNRRKALVNQALNQLPEDERDILVLVDMLGHSVVEASGILSTNENTLYSRLRKARKTLAASLRRLGAIGGDV